MKQVLLLLFACSLLQCFRCVTVVSGTTDTGNAKIVGSIYTLDGQLASGATVTILPSEHKLSTPDGQDDKLIEIVTDEFGCFNISSLQNGTYNVEVNDGKSAVMHTVVVDNQHPSTIDIVDTLKAYGVFSGRVDVVDSTISRYILIKGLNRAVKILPDGSFFVGDLPQGTFNIEIVSFESSDWVPIGINDVEVVSEDTLQIPFVGWQHKAQIVFNTSETGADVSEDVFGFPVLIKLTDSNFDFSETRSDGSDCRFYKNDTIQLPFHIEMWDSSLQRAYIWVKVDTVYGNNAEQFITMRWGNPNVLQLNDSGSVFDTANGFLGCYHFGGNVNDATVNKFNGIDSGTVEIPNGAVGLARTFNGTSYIDLGVLPDRPEGSISCWVRSGAIINAFSPVTYGVWGKYESDEINYTLSFQGAGYYSGSGGSGVSGNLISKAEDSITGYYLSSEMATFNQNEWYHIAWSWGENGNSLFVNGKTEMTAPEYRPMYGTGSDEIGRSHYDSSNVSSGGPHYFFGAIDEFRIDKVPRSESWIKLCYKNQLPFDDFVVFNRL